MTIPTPLEFGAPAKFSEWRPSQYDLFRDMTHSKRRYFIGNAPTGSGKSPAYILAAMGARDKGRRIAVITESKGLQKQLQEEFSSVGLYDMRGQNNYPCKALLPEGDYDWMWHKQWGDPTCDLGPCHAGIKCTLRDRGCDYFDSVKEALGSRMVSTNYAYWIACNRFGEGLGKFDWLILDEAHAAHNQLVSALTVELTQKDFAELNSKPPKVGAGILAWRVWADTNWKQATGRVEGMKVNLPSVYSAKEMPDAQEVRFWKNLENKLAMAAAMQDNWIIQETEDGVITISPPWVSSFAEEYLFHSIPKIILVSATIVPKTARLLGIDDSLLEFKSYPSSFPKERRPIVWIPTVKVMHDSYYDNPATMKADRKAWAARIDQIISKRTDRKGIIHTVSFARQKYLMEHSKFKHLFVPTETKGTAKAVEKFKQSKQPAILVSPSVATGYDFPYGTARYQIISKMPFPVKTDAVIQAQTVDDPDYPAYLCAQALVQMYGRPNRAADDFSETFVVDDNFKWFVSQYSEYWYHELASRFKKRRTNDRPNLFPDYFMEAVSVSYSVPDAPKFVVRGAN